MIAIKDIKAYVQGKVRYKLYYSKFKFLIRKHIREQIEVRINSMDKDCYNQGQCKLCGCETTALQMANKACDKPCYPKMLSKSEWLKIRFDWLGHQVFSTSTQIFDISTGKWWHIWNIHGKPIFAGQVYKSFEDMIDKQPKPNSKLEESNIEFFKSCEADIITFFTSEGIALPTLKITPNNNCE